MQDARLCRRWRQRDHGLRVLFDDAHEGKVLDLELVLKDLPDVHELKVVILELQALVLEDGAGGRGGARRRRDV